MSVEVRVTAILQRLLGGSKVVQDEARTIGQLLDNLDSRYPGFKERVLNEEGNLQRFVNIYVNDEDIRFMRQLDTPVADGDVISILPAMAGGAPPPLESASMVKEKSKP